jgi:predicted porin
LVAETSFALDGTDPSGAALNGLEAALRANSLNTLADDIAINEDDSSFFGLGFSIDYDNFLFDAEYTQFEVENSILTEQTQYYASVGYRLDDVIVHFTYEDNDDKHDASRFDPIATVPSLNAAINGALTGVQAQSNVYTIGARYDFHPSAAFKIDFSRFEDDVTDTETDVVAVGVDLVF